MKTIPTRKKPLVTASLLAAGLIFSAPSHSIILFQDNFDNDASTTTLNFDSLQNWTVSEGTIDYIKNGSYGIQCLGNTGGCLDMDGTTNNAGRITSKTLFSLKANVTYTLEFQYSGNQRLSSNDAFQFGFNNLFTLTVSSIARDTPFTLASHTFSPVSDQSSQLFIEDLGNDTGGVILDNVVLRDNTNPSIPEPASLALLGIGLVGIGFVRRQRRG